MPRRRRRSPISVTLVLPAERPAQKEIDAVLMATDAIIGRAGRSGVTLILNGSRSKKALEWEWDRLPDYGALRHLTADQITRKVDWCIHHKWLRLEHNRDGIPLLYHSTKGWERVKQLWVERLLGWFEDWLNAGRPERGHRRAGTARPGASAVCLVPPRGTGGEDGHQPHPTKPRPADAATSRAQVGPGWIGHSI